MCTVTYLPVNNGFILTSNRDERLLRKPATSPEIITRGKHKILFPRDGEAGGAWIATADNGRTACLLNGAFVPHQRQPPYRKSRGLVLLDFFETNSVSDFSENYDLTGIEPFTLMVAEEGRLYELKWDGTHKYLESLNEKEPCIRCSVTLYLPEVIAMREQWFAEWLRTHRLHPVSEILRFHLFAGKGDEATNIRMSRYGIVKTVSISCVHTDTDIQKMYYSDLGGTDGFRFDCYSFDHAGSKANLNDGLSISI